MGPKSPRHKNKTKNVIDQQIGTAADNAGVLAVNYDEVQAEEVEVLKAIYMDDFEEIETRSAWSRTTERSFKLRLRAFSDEESFVVLSVTLTTTYPKSAPIMSVAGSEAFHERTRAFIRGVLRDRPKQFSGEVMIHAIASEIQDALEDAVQARQQGTLPSLDDERATAEVAALALAKETQEADARRVCEELEEEDRMLKQMVDDEVNRRGRKKASKRDIDDSIPPTTNISADHIIFEQSADIRTEHDTLKFGSVMIISKLSSDRGKQVLLGKPDTGQLAQTPMVVIKRVVVERSREEIMETESFLELARKFHHDAVLTMYTFRVDRLDNCKSQMTLCYEYADRGSLHAIMELSTIQPRKARQFITEILEGLDFLHRNGVAHGNLTSRTVLLKGHLSPSVRLADYGMAKFKDTSQHTSPARWQAPEPDNAPPQMQRKSDIWNAGIILCQMFVSPKVTLEHISPQAMMSRLAFSEPFEDLVQKMFSADAKKRPSAFELLPAEFIRTEVSVLSEQVLVEHSRLPSRNGNGAFSPGYHRSRHNSSSIMDPTSRYVSDFVEIGRLGKGGFGEVVKARNKLDGGVYAVKKIKQTQQLLDQVLSEVMLLNRLNHPYVVRYFSTWVENDFSRLLHDDIVSTTDDMTDTNGFDGNSSDESQVDFTYQSTGGLDFVSSSGYPNIEFGHDDDDENNEDSQDDSANSGSEDSFDITPENGLALDGAVAASNGNGTSSERLSMKRTRSDSRRVPAVLYIQMEYCERQTLRDIIRRGMSLDDSWRYVRQVTEGLAHIHSHGIIHRDLKPDNIFIDVAGNPKIGDFGLATTGQYHAVGRSLLMSGASAGGEMTRSVGTALYVAPELKSGSSGPYNDKVDMYSLGIMFYEMCEAFSTAMERIKALQAIREKVHELPLAYRANGEKEAQGKLMSCLISHKPSERPTSTELLRSDILPLKIEDETIRQALSGLSDPRSPYHQKMMSALFSHEGANSVRVKALAWDAKSQVLTEDSRRMRFRGLARQTLETIFKKHGAEETRRESIFPRSGFYTNANVVQLLDASSNMLQLPYDLILPHARQLAQRAPEVKKTYVFGSAYRDAFTGGPPRISEEVDFDIASIRSDEEPDFDDAEVIKLMDEIVTTLPYFATISSICFHVNHGALLDVILEHSRVSGAQQAGVKEALSRLGFHQWNWAKVRADLRKFGLPDTTLEDIEQFDFRDTPEKAFTRLQDLLRTINPRLKLQLDEAIEDLTRTLSILSKLKLQRRLYIAPLASVNAKFYDGGMLFQCVLDRKTNRTVIAAGGRYDKLVQLHRPVDGQTGAKGAVGVSIGLDPIIGNMMRNAGDSHKDNFLKDKLSQKNVPIPKRCEVLVVAGGTEGARSVGIRILNSLWSNDIGAEIAPALRTSFDESQYNYLITIRHEASPTVRFKHTSGESEETDVPVNALVSHLQQEIRERESTRVRMPPIIHRHSGHQDVERKSNVQVLMSQHRSKKSNKYHIVEAAQNQWTEKLDNLKDAPILAIETRDDVLDLIRETRLGDVETWRRVVQSVPLNERQYLQQVQDLLSRWRKTWQDGGESREACVFNFRTGHCIYYDLGL